MIDTKNILKDECNIVLNEKQVEAVESEADNCIVVAGAGTGKTTTLAAKAKYLVKEKGIDPKRILILSFSNKSVNDIRKKIKYTLNLDCEIRTFHSLGLKIWNDYRNSVEADFKDDDSETIGQINKTFNWKLFHRQGIELAVEVKKLLPKNVFLKYVTPFEDESNLIPKEILIREDRWYVRNILEKLI